jgi:hypothetical protein
MERQNTPSIVGSGPRFTPARVRELSLAGHLVVLFCLLVNVYAGWLVYAPLLNNEWGDWDDHTWRRDTERRNTLGTIFDPLLVTGHEGMDTSYVPVQSLLYHISANVIGQGGIPIRVLGIWLHIINACLVMVMALRFCRSVPAAHVASLLFLIYPRNAESISWLCASLAHGLVLFFYLLTFLVLQSYLHRRGWWRLVLGTLFFTLAALTKELATTLLAAMVLYDVLVVMGPRELWPFRWKIWMGLAGRHAPMLVVFIAVVVIQLLKYDTGFVHTKFGGVEFGWRNPLRLLELLTLIVHWGPVWTRELMLWGMGGVFAVIMAGIWAFRRQPTMLFLLLCIPLVVIPFTISNFRDVNRLGRYLYEASAILSVLLAVMSVKLLEWRRQLTWPLLNAAVVLLVVFAMTIPRIIH